MNLSRDMHGASLVMEHHSIVPWQLNLHSCRNLLTFRFDIKFRTSASFAALKVTRLAHLRTFVSDVIWSLLLQVSCTATSAMWGLRIDTIFVTLEMSVSDTRSFDYWHSCPQYPFFSGNKIESWQNLHMHRQLDIDVVFHLWTTTTTENWHYPFRQE